MIARLSELTTVIVSTFAIIKAKLDEKVDIGGMIDDSSKLNGQPAAYYAKAEDLTSFAAKFETSIRDSTDLFYGILKQPLAVTAVEYDTTKNGYKLAGSHGDCTPTAIGQHFTINEIYWTSMANGSQLGLKVTGDKTSIDWKSFNLVGFYFVETAPTVTFDGTNTSIVFNYTGDVGLPAIGAADVELRYIPA